MAKLHDRVKVQPEALWDQVFLAPARMLTSRGMYVMQLPDRVRSSLRDIQSINTQGAPLLLLLFLCTDLGLTLFHIIKHIPLVTSPAVHVRINAYLELYHLVKLFWIILLCVYVLSRTKCLSFLSWILIFSFILFDDALLIHQSIGPALEKGAGLLLAHPRLPPRVYELAVLTIFGAILSALLAYTYHRSTEIFKRFTNDMLLFILGLVFFGLLVDVVSVFRPGHIIMVGLDIVEDWGEMTVFSLIIWYVFQVATHKAMRSEPGDKP